VGGPPLPPAPRNVSPTIDVARGAGRPVCLMRPKKSQNKKPDFCLSCYNPTMKCWECEQETNDIHHHHVVPRCRGGTKTVPLCVSCHSKAHHRKKNMNTGQLTREGIARRRAKGLPIGGSAEQLNRSRAASIKIRNYKAKQFALKMLPIIEEIKNEDKAVTLQDIADGLNKRDHTTPRGNKWHPASVQRVLKRFP